MGEGQHLEKPNVDQLIFQNFEISNIKRTKDELFDFFIFEFIFYFNVFELFEHSKYMIIYKLGNLWNFKSFRNCKILYFFKLNNFINLMIFEIGKFSGIFQIENF